MHLNKQPALLPPGIFLCSNRHSCGEEGSVPGKHPWSHTGCILPHPMPGSPLLPAQPIPPLLWVRNDTDTKPSCPAGPAQGSHAGPHFRELCQRSPTVPAAIHFHNHWFFHLRNTFSSKRYTARFSKLELWEWEISLVMVAVTEYKCVRFPESNSGTSKGECLLVCLLIYSPFPLLFSCAVCTTEQSVVEQNDIIRYNVLQ